MAFERRGADRFALRVAAALLLSVLVAVGACRIKHHHGEYDRKALEEAEACVKPPALSPPSGAYEDQGIELDWDRLVDARNPKRADMSYVSAVLEDPAKLEQVYYDATHGNARASFLACHFDVGARAIGRGIARTLTGFKCRAITTCEFRAEELPLSEETASGQRLLIFLAEQFDYEAKRQGAWDELIGYAMPLVAGRRISTRVRPSGPLIIPGARGPGRWVRVNETMSARARAYQERITRHTSREAYEVNGVKFDGYRRGVLLEAKGPGYANFVKNGKFRKFFSGQQSLLDQAERQKRAANGRPIEWHVAETEFARVLRRFLGESGFSQIRVVHTP